jgi:hypothetical protein
VQGPECAMARDSRTGSIDGADPDDRVAMLQRDGPVGRPPARFLLPDLALDGGGEADGAVARADA